MKRIFAIITAMLTGGIAIAIGLGSSVVEAGMKMN
jgi:hypothetical protein